MTKRVLLVDSDDLLRRSLADQLVSQGFSVIEAASAAAAGAAAPMVDLVVVDSKPADRAAADLCLALRTAGHGQPIVVLAPLDAEQAALQEAGANECIAKPFRVSTLVRRLQVHLRAPADDRALPIGGMRFHPLSRQLVDGDGNRVRLTEKEAAILSYLYRAGDRVVPREELLGEVWGYSAAISTHTLETHIYRLRRKLVDGRAGLAVLVSEGGGYRMQPRR